MESQYLSKARARRPVVPAQPTRCTTASGQAPFTPSCARRSQETPPGAPPSRRPPTGLAAGPPPRLSPPPLSRTRAAVHRGQVLWQERPGIIWWALCSHPGDKQDFLKLLVPSTLYEAMITPTTGKTKPQRVLSFKNALPQRQRKMKDALSKALTWLAEDPPPLPRPPPKVSTTGANKTASTARHTPHRRTANITIPCPRTTCQTLFIPPPQKSHAPAKTKSPCNPNNNPRNAAGTRKILHHAKLQVTPTPLSRWQPPNPLALTAPTDGLLISSELQPPLYLRPSRPHQRVQRRNLFRSPPSLALPFPIMRFLLGQTQSEPKPN